MQNRNFFEDVLVGGYKYVVNGTTVVNTLPLLNNNYSEQEKYTLFGNIIISPNSPYCDNCNTNTRIVWIEFWEPNRDVWNMGPQMQFRRVDDAEGQKVKVVFRTTSTATPNSLHRDPEFDTYGIPLDTYVLKRQ